MIRNQEHGSFPKTRQELPRAPFASLWTLRPEDADRAYAVYARLRFEPLGDGGPYFDVWCGRSFNAPTITSTQQYIDEWELDEFSDGDRAVAIEYLSSLDAHAVMAARKHGSPVIRWEVQRRHWICEWLVRYQLAYELNVITIRQFRESGRVVATRMLGDHCCDVCHSLYPGNTPIDQDVEIPVPGCVAPNGCNCRVVAVPEMDVAGP